MKKLLFCSLIILAGCSVSKMGAITEPKQFGPNYKPAEVVGNLKPISPIRTQAERDSIMRAYIKGLINPYVSELKESQRLSAENLQRILEMKSAHDDSLSLQNVFFQNSLTRSIFALDSATKAGFQKDYKIDSMRHQQEITNKRLSVISGRLEDAIEFFNSVMAFYKKFSSVIFWLMIAYFSTLLLLSFINLVRTANRKSHV